MDLYLFCIGLGFCGLIAMVLLGLSHGTDGGHPHAGGGRGGSHHGHGHAVGGRALPKHGFASTKNLAVGRSLLALLSPRIMFSLLFAFGATGFLLRPLLPPPVVWVLAALGAWLFERYLVQPVWNFVFGFASAPSRNLESTLLEEAQAVTNFNAAGEGLVSVVLNGQILQLLARLEPGEQRFGVRVRAGDRLSVVAVDAHRNSCTVTPLPIRRDSA